MGEEEEEEGKEGLRRNHKGGEWPGGREGGGGGVYTRYVRKVAVGWIGGCVEFVGPVQIALIMPRRPN